MTFERSGLLLDKPQTPASDVGMEESLRRVLEPTSQIYKKLTISGERKDDVLDSLHSGDSPDMTATHLSESELDIQLAKLKKWKNALLEVEDLDPLIRQAYRWRINEDIANVHMLRASAAGDMRSFRRWNEFIYGKPNEPIYRAALDWVAGDADSLIDQFGVDSPQGQAAQSVLDNIGARRGDRSLLVPSEETFQSVRTDHMREGGYYSLLLAGVEVPTEAKVRRDVGEPILRHVVTNNLQSDYDIKPVEGTVWGVDHVERVVEQPEEYAMPPKRFVGLGAGHEIGTHLLEKENGDRGPIKLASRGLDRQEVGEGRAVVREQVVYDTFDEFGTLVRWRDIIRRDIAIGFASGVADERMRTAAETYDFIYAIDLMYQTKLKPNDPEVAAEKAKRKTDPLILRVLKGTDGTGGAYLKDKLYLEGNVAVWRAAEMYGPGIISDGDLGKFDITNSRHIVLLQKLGLLPSYGD
ncbi:hypothetical protein H6800_01690 [Candidatus Nomurabacteria bacterium]|nr:hypothetical protein [Candidatus Nomurabacteria bacterium]